MLSKKSGKLFVFVIKWCNFCGGMPLIWDGRRGQLRATKKGQVRWGCAFFLQVLLCLFTYYRLVKITLNFYDFKCAYPDRIRFRRASSLYKYKFINMDVEIVYCYLLATIYALLVALSINMVKTYKELVLFTNSYLKFTAYFRESYTVRLGRLWKNGCEDWVQLMITLAISAPIIPTLHYLLNPWHPQYITSLLISLEEKEELDLTIMLYKYGLAMTILLTGTFVMFQIVFIWIVTSTLLFITANVTISAYVLTSTITEMTLSSTIEFPQLPRFPRRGQYLIKNHVTKDKLRTIPNLLRCYRSFQIFERMAHLCFAELAFVIEVLQIIFISLTVYILFHFWKQISLGSIILLCLFLFLIIPYWVFILRLIGKFKGKTEKCCESWKFIKLNFVNEIRYLKAIRRSCHPITITAGFNLFEMQIKHVPYFIFYIACGIILWHLIYHDFVCREFV
ncbi:unnamed protein product [Orchesella dallaii]|uniref:Gustatory receptor n=1 Tax=Orchesella dallaii TaxID=48710 RepID=A0ABP1QEB0_9HEXA